MISFNAPEPSADAILFQIIERRGFMEGPIGVHGSRSLEVGPKDDFTIGGTKKTTLSASTESIFVNLSGEFLSAFQCVANGG